MQLPRSGLHHVLTGLVQHHMLLQFTRTYILVLA